MEVKILHSIRIEALDLISAGELLLSCYSLKRLEEAPKS